MIGKGAAARWEIVGEARPVAADAHPAELGLPSTALTEGKRNGAHHRAAMNGTTLAAHGASTTDRATARLLANYERARRALEERRRMIVVELAAIDSQLEGPSFEPATISVTGRTGQPSP